MVTREAGDLLETAGLNHLRDGKVAKIEVIAGLEAFGIVASRVIAGGEVLPKGDGTEITPKTGRGGDLKVELIVGDC